MDTLKLFSCSIIFFIFLSCKNDKTMRDDCNFKYILIDNYPFKSDSITVKMIIYKKNTSTIIKEFNDFSVSCYNNTSTKSKNINIKLNFDNNNLLDKNDFKIIVDDKYSFLFEELTTKIDTFIKPKILGNDIYIYKSLKAKVNDSIMKFEDFDIHSDKSITLPFYLSKKKQFSLK